MEARTDGRAGSKPPGSRHLGLVPVCVAVRERLPCFASINEHRPSMVVSPVLRTDILIYDLERAQDGKKGERPRSQAGKAGNFWMNRREVRSRASAASAARTYVGQLTTASSQRPESRSPETASVASAIELTPFLLLKRVSSLLEDK